MTKQRVGPFRRNVNQAIIDYSTCNWWCEDLYYLFLLKDGPINVYFRPHITFKYSEARVEN